MDVQRCRTETGCKVGQVLDRSLSDRIANYRIEVEAVLNERRSQVLEALTLDAPQFVAGFRVTFFYKCSNHVNNVYIGGK